MAITSEELARHLEIVLDPLAEGLVIPFLGAGVNLCGRPADASWGVGRYLPSGWELTEHLATKFAYPKGEPKDLLRVSQYVWVTRGGGPLYTELRKILAPADKTKPDYPITPLHEFLARLPGRLRSKGYPGRQFLIVTTNYDDVLEQAFERAFDNAGEPYDVVTYVAHGEDRFKFRHRPPGAHGAVVVERPNEYQGLLIGPDGRPRESWNVILKIHGAIDRDDMRQDSFVITEDHYIDYLIQPDIANLLPVPLPAKLRESHYLFLGYGLKDWNLRVILRRIWRDQELSYKSWAIEVKDQPLEEKFWRERGVDIIKADLKDYVAELDRRVLDLPAVGGEA